MIRRIRAHFDGKVIVPDEPGDFEPGETLEVTRHQTLEPEPTPAQRLAALEEFVRLAHVRPVPHLPLEALRRENLYEDR